MKSEVSHKLRIKMTHSYAKRAWASGQMAKGFLGRDVIARACGVPSKTVSSWYRAETSRSAPLLRTAREDQRALGIVLLEHFPKYQSDIAKILRTYERALLQWRNEYRNRTFRSDLQAATDYLVSQLRPGIMEYFAVQQNQLTLSQEFLPETWRFYEQIWMIFDFHLELILFGIQERKEEAIRLKFFKEQVQQRDQRSDQIESLERKVKDLRTEYSFIIGPHARRGARIGGEFGLLTDDCTPIPAEDRLSYGRNYFDYLRTRKYRLAPESISALYREIEKGETAGKIRKQPIYLTEEALDSLASIFWAVILPQPELDNSLGSCARDDFIEVMRVMSIA